MNCRKLSFLAFLFSSQIFAQSTWTGAINNDWGNSGNWTAGVPGSPGSPDLEAIFPSTIPSTGSIIAFTTLQNPTLNTITVNNSYQFGNSEQRTFILGGGTNPPNLNITSGILTMGNQILFEISSSAGTATINGSLNTQGSLYVLSPLSFPINSVLASEGSNTPEGYSVEFFHQTPSTSTITGSFQIFSIDIHGPNTTVNWNSNVPSILNSFRLANEATFHMLSGDLTVKNNLVTDPGTEFIIDTASFTTNDSTMITNGAFFLSTNGTVALQALTMNNEAILEIQNGPFSCTDLTVDSASVTFANGSFTTTGDFILQNGATFTALAGTISAAATNTITGPQTSFNNGSATVSFGGDLTVQKSAIFNTLGGSVSLNGNFALQSNAIFNQQGGTVTLNDFLSDKSTANIDSGSFTATGEHSTFTSSALNINGGSVFFENLSFTNSSFFLNNASSTSILTNLILQNSNFQIVSGDFDFPVFTRLTSSSIQIEQGDFNPQNFFIELEHSFNGNTFVSVANGDILLSNTYATSVIADNSILPGDTFTLFSTLNGMIQNPDSIVYPTSSSLIWINNFYSTEHGQSITVSAHASHPSPHATIGSINASQPLTTLQRNENMRESRMRGMATSHYHEVASNVTNGSLVAQNSLLAQSSNVEQLGERAIERSYNQWAVYIAPTGSFGSMKTTHGQLGNSYYTAGFMTGFDWATSYIHDPELNYAFGIGSTFYYNHLHADVDFNGGKSNVDQVFANIYATWISRDLEELSINFSVGAGYDFHHFDRTTGDFGTLTAHSDPGGYEVGTFLALEYLFSRCQFPRMGSARFIPIAMVQYNWLSLNDYRETGAGIFNLDVKTESLNSLRTFLGARANYLFREGYDVTIRPEVTLGWQREYLCDTQNVTFSNFNALNPQTATLETIAPCCNNFILGADLYVMMYDWTSLQFNYQWTYNHLITNNSFYLEWKVEF